MSGDAKAPKRGGKFAGDDPIAIIRRWQDKAAESEINDPGAMALASVDGDGMPNVRMVLLKEITEPGFVFYTNFESAKGRELLANPKAAFVMHWKSLRRQVRVRGPVEQVPDEQADAYFASRPLKSRIGAWASDQSRPLDARSTLVRRVAAEGAKRGVTPDRPPHWSGFLIRPLEIELWADGEFRLHDRFRFTRQTIDRDWQVTRLYP